MSISFDSTDSMKKILAYSQMSEDEQATIAGHLREFIAMSDHNGTDDKTRTIRRELNKDYYTLYRHIFFVTLEDSQIPPEVLMFLYYGYIDATLAGEENAQILYKLATTTGLDEEMHVFPFYQWLRLIYMGKVEPCVNEFTQDYPTYLRSLRKEGRITEAKEKELLYSNRDKVIFELENMFRTNNRVVSGHISTFCPFFDKDTVYRPLEQSFINYTNVNQTLNVIRALDYSVFYRETIFTAPEVGVQKTIISVEILPEIILMPCFGERGSMWQETTGAKRTTPGRMILPVFLSDELIKVMIRLCGEFRWELCRRIQGARWNDLSEHSLTSEYCDFLQTYKKNHDISEQARDKIKSSLVKHRNSFKDVFADDYCTYMIYESTGAVRMNKVARKILFTYCPFSKTLREGPLYANPQYSALIDHRNTKQNHAIHLQEVAINRLEKENKAVPYEMRAYLSFLRM